MPNFITVGFRDTWELAVSLHARMNMFRPLDSGEHILDVRWQDGPDAEAPGWKRTGQWPKWPQLTNTVTWVERIGEALLGPMERGRIFFWMLDPGARLPWVAEDSAYSRSSLRVHLPIRTNPAAMMYSGVETAHLLPGQVTRVNTLAPCSAINLGEWPVVHLVIDLRLKPQQLAANRPSPASSPWRPIETAPRDGRTIIVGRDMGEPWGFVRGTGQWAGTSWICRGFTDPPGGLGLAAPSHWTPFPDPPSPASEGK